MYSQRCVIHVCKENGRIIKTEVGVKVSVLHNSVVLNIFTVKGGNPAALASFSHSSENV